MKKFLKIAISIFICIIALAFASCVITPPIDSGSQSSSELHIHTWNDVGHIVKNATCATDGVVEYSCTGKGCNEKYSETIPKLSKDGTHTGGNATCYTKPTCSVCGEQYGKTLSHTGVPTCEEKAKCLLCGEEIAALGHDLKEIEAKESTCTEVGWNAYETCKREDCDYTTYEEIAPNNHDYQNRVCTRCGAKEPSEGLEYTLSDDGTYYSVTGIGTCTDTDIVIPDTYDNLPVTSIGDSAFMRCTSLTSVVIPDSVTSIEAYAFSDCISLTGVIIPDSVTSIIFNAFEHCKSLTSIRIPDSVEIIGGEVFSNCDSLTSITVDENNETYKDVDGNLYSKDGTTLIQYAMGKTETAFTIPDSVISIGERAFENCDSLISVEIGDSVTSIGYMAFWYCTSLTSVIIPDSVTSIGSSAFNRCTNLTSVEIGNSVTSIEMYTFAGCTSLESITIGKSVTSINISAFDRCTSLVNIFVDAANEYYKDIDGNLYSKDGTTLIQYAIGKTATSFTIPDSVTSIGDYAFEDCVSLTSVVIPDSVKSIGDQVFRDCTNLTSITFNGTIEEWNTITKGNLWNYKVPATEVICTDGSVALS